MFIDDFSQAYWIIAALNVVDGYAYFVTVLNLTVHLTINLHASTYVATAIYGLWGAAVGLIGMLAGPLIDRWGIRHSLLVGGFFSAFGRLVVAASTTTWHVVVGMFVFQSIGCALSMPVYTIATHRAVPPERRRMAFAINYSLMNVSAMLAGAVTDWFGVSMMLMIFMTAFAVSCGFIMVAYMLNDADFALVEKSDDDDNALSIVEQMKIEWKNPIMVRVMVFSVVLVGARSLYRHMDTTLPLYLLKMVGPSAHYGLIYMINPLLIIALSPMMASCLESMDIYGLMIMGTGLTAVSPLINLLVAWPYAGSIAFLVAFSIGEAMYSPRTSEFLMLLATPGREGLYSTMATIPSFVSKLLVGFTSGALVDAYCSDDDAADRCRFVWLPVALIALTTTIVLAVAKSWLYTDEIRMRMRQTSAVHIG